MVNPARRIFRIRQKNPMCKTKKGAPAENQARPFLDIGSQKKENTANFT